MDETQDTEQLMDMLLAKKRSSDRKAWLESKGQQRKLQGGNAIEVNCIKGSIRKAR